LLLHKRDEAMKSDRIVSTMRAALGAVFAVVLGTSFSQVSAVSQQERTALIDLYNSAGGAGWTNNTNWNGAAGTECTWHGVTCLFAGGPVAEIDLYNNNLVGTLPPSLSPFKSLRRFSVGTNELTGSLPSLTGLTSIESVYFTDNKFTGALPSLAGLTTLQEFDAGGPGGRNQLTGTIPSLAGLTALRIFNVNNNRLTGSIPSLGGLNALESFTVFNNLLTGAIPSLSGLSALTFIDVSSNQLSGSIPSLSGLAALKTILVQRNRLTGSLPPLAGLNALEEFAAQENQLTGAIPSLAGLGALQRFRVEANQLSGSVPAVPAPTNALLGPESELCPNQLAVSVDAAWDAATGSTPWSATCTAALPNQTLTFGAPPTLVIGGSGTVVASASPLPNSLQPVRFASLTPLVCGVNASSGLTVVQPTAMIGDTCTIAADKAGDATANSAPQAQQSIVIAAAPAAVAVTPVPALGFFGLVGLALSMISIVAAAQRRPTSRRQKEHQRQ
jgi:hypothetical protein